MKIAIFESTRIGNLVVMIPFLVKLRKAFPDSKITLITSIIEATELVNEFHIYFDNIIQTGIGRFRRLSILKNIILHRYKEYDYLITGSPPIKSFGALIAYRLINAKKKIKYIGSTGELNVSEMWLSTLNHLGIEVKESDIRWPPLFQYSFQDHKKINELIFWDHQKKHKLLIGFHMFTKHRKTVLWEVKKWIRLVKYIKEKYPSNIVFLGGKDAILNAAEISDGLNHNILDLTGKLSLKETALVLNDLDLVVCINSGIMNMASAMDVPLVCISGSSRGYWRPFGKNSLEVKKIINRKYCDPPCNLPKCKWDDFKCMKNIKVSDVVKAVEKII